MIRYAAVSGALGGSTALWTGNIAGAAVMAALAVVFGLLAWCAVHWNDDAPKCDACGGDGYHDRPMTLSGMRFQGTPCMRCHGSGVDPMDTLPEIPGRFLMSVHTKRDAARERRRAARLRRKYPPPPRTWKANDYPEDHPF